MHSPISAVGNGIDWIMSTLNKEKREMTKKIKQTGVMALKCNGGCFQSVRVVIPDNERKRKN